MIMMIIIMMVMYNCPIEISHQGNSGRFSGEASCDRVALPNLQCVLGFSVFPKSTYGLSCVCDLFACVYIHTYFLWGILSAQNFGSEKTCLQSMRKAWHETVTHPCGDHARSCLTAVLGSEYSPCALPTHLDFHHHDDDRKTATHTRQRHSDQSCHT